MKRFAAVAVVGVILTLSVSMVGYAQLNEWFKKPGGSPPVITHWFASEELHHGDTWRIYVAAKDPDGDMDQFVGVLEQVGYGRYPSNYVRIKGKNREEVRGYLVFYSTSGMGLWLAEWTQLRLTLFIQDRGRNSSNKVVLPVILSHGARQGSPPPPFSTGGLSKLGVFWFDLVESGINGDEIYPD